VAEWLVSHHHVDECIVNSDIKHKGPSYVFANAGVKSKVVETEDLNQVVEKFFSTPGQTGTDVRTT